MSLISGSDRITRFTGKCLLQPSLASATPVQIAITASSTALGARLKALGDVFEEFRFRRIVVKMHPSGTAASSYVMTYFKTIPSTITGATITTDYEGTASRLSAGTETVPQTLLLNKSVLLGGLRTWYDTDTTSSDVEDSVQGVFVLTTNQATAFTLIIEIGYDVEFRGATTPTID
jgi:hypothetical protein